MRRRPHLLVVLVLAACAFAPAAVARPHRPKPTCRPSGADVVGSSRRATLFFTYGGGEYPPSTLFGCVRSTHRSRVLQRFDDQHAGSLARVRFAGSYVAVAETVTDQQCDKYQPGPHCVTGRSVRSYDLRTGRTRAVAGGRADAVVLTVDGWIAWIPPGGDPSHRTLIAIDAAGRRTLDTGAIAPSSLSCTGRTVHWTDAGVRRSARLD